MGRYMIIKADILIFKAAMPVDIEIRKVDIEIFKVDIQVDIHFAEIHSAPTNNAKNTGEYLSIAGTLYYASM